MALLLQSLLLQQHLLSHHILKDQFLIPSLLLTLNFPQTPEDSLGHPPTGYDDEQHPQMSNITRVWPSRTQQDPNTLEIGNRFPNKEDLQVTMMANQLAIAQLSQVVLGLFGPRLFSANHSRWTPTLGEVTRAFSAIRGETGSRHKPAKNVAQPGQFPWLVSVQVTNFYDASYHLCGGTILSPRWVLTAASCLDGEKASSLQVVAGELDMTHQEGAEQSVPVTRLLKHPHYTYWETPYKNDLALLQLVEPLVLGEQVKVAALPSLAFLPSTVGECREAGWGVSEEGAAGSRILMFVDVSLMLRQDCHAAYPSLGDSEVCAGPGGAGSCVGDNGGTLMCVTRDGRTLSAVMSWREGCARPGKPAVYMDVAKYLPWILNTTGL
ncbi:trypsin-1 [Procambarus clarkii]|uniref:trypsin-1 n=1 Tax=Procambarus clarkii TaxID=6728 RepID=UPI001E676A3E|nr:trypsin-1-like [Procambarus clarkii]